MLTPVVVPVGSRPRPASMAPRAPHARGGGVRGGGVGTRGSVARVGKGPNATTYRDSRRNAVRVATCAPVGTVALVPCRSPYERAHRQYGPDGMLYPNASVDARGRLRPLAGSEPRLYPPALLTSARRAWDEVYDETHARAKRLEGMVFEGQEVGYAVREAMAKAQSISGAEVRPQTRISRRGA